jgi:uncharacterized protein
VHEPARFLIEGEDRLDNPTPFAPSNVPVETYILKVASRCNLNCTYCYVYNMGDESYRSQPRRMARDTVSALLSRVATYCGEQDLHEVTFIFHGGEPLLAGTDFFRHFVAVANAVLQPHVLPSFALETNGTLLTTEWLELFQELGINFGISLDGPRAINDANRLDRRGGGSYAKVRRAIDTVLADRRFEQLFGGVLTVVNLAADPVGLYHHYREIGLHRCDFLLPDGTYDHPPSQWRSDGEGTPYADWLIAVFDEWFDEDSSLSIRIFDEIIGLLFCSAPGTDALGGGQNGLLVIETDGGIEPVDVLKICGPSFTKLDLNVHRNEIRDACAVELVQAYQKGAAGLCATCLACPVVAICGGGYLPHRYSSLNGFANPSVYCRDLMKLITHIRDRVLATIPAATRQKLGLRPLSSQDARSRLTGGSIPDDRTFQGVRL